VIHEQLEGGVARLTIDRPGARNALDLETIEGLSAALGRLAGHPELRVVVLTGAGDRVFCAGADLAGLAGNPEARRGAVRRYGALLVELLDFPRPVVARVNGACLAGGMGLLLACDLAVASDDATFFLPEAAVGRWPMLVGALLRRVVGERVALALALTGRKLDAPTALGLGLVNRVGAVDAEIDALVAALLRQSPSAVRLGRRAWRDAAGLPLPAALDLLSDRLGDLMETDDAAEGFLAFLQRRPPVWSDR
jgi:enoyl-CoA hydratase/carnithine racemase